MTCARFSTLVHLPVHTEPHEGHPLGRVAPQKLEKLKCAARGAGNKVLCCAVLPPCRSWRSLSVRRRKSWRTD